MQVCNRPLAARTPFDPKYQKVFIIYGLSCIVRATYIINGLSVSESATSEEQIRYNRVVVP